MIFFLSRIIRTFSALLSILLLKYFGSNDILGSFMYWYIIILFAGIFIRFNHQVFVLRFTNVINEKFSSLFFNQLFFWVIANLMLFFILPFGIYIINIILLTVLLFDPWESYYTIVKDYKLTNKVIIVISLFSIFIKFATIILVEKNELVLYFLGLSILDFSTGLALFVFYVKDFSFYKRFLIKDIILTFNFLFPFLLNGLFIYLASKVDHFLIKNKFAYNELGVYSFSYKLYEGFFIFQTVLNSLVISKFKSNFISEKFNLNFIFFIKKWFLGSGFFIAVCCLGLFFINRFVKHEVVVNLEVEIKIFMILLPGLFFSFFGVLMSIMAGVNGYSKEILIINIVVFLISLTLNYFLLDIYGVYIAALITLLNQFLSSFLFWFFFPRTRFFILNLVKLLH